MGCASMIEAYPTCVHLNQLGYHAFALNYRCKEHAKAPNPLDDMAYALTYILEAFLLNQINIVEVEKLFYKGSLGKQIFLKSEKAF
ncbi:Uncharacterised protein [[Eubacterium] contortum]|uniref:Uncharacterized protein n=2 Tax=Bacillota TaxID=1239 RepID=A0A173ZD85_9FIRM|nr:Uncharacterised protein [[Eubacterium] contortum] [Faecalicatena contorta]